MEFIGENLLPGKLGHLFVILSFVSAILAGFSFYKSSNAELSEEKNNWKKLGRISFYVQAFSVLAIFALLFFIIRNHLFEYKYAWQHSSRALEMKYLLSCFWEGQEGSFLLWSFWHGVLGIILINRAKEWEAPVMTVVSFAQFCLASMILGIYVFNLKIGSNPFVLLRNEMDAPIFSNPNYLSFITDGNDLNPLLQNYWMVIHPPVLFLGFASTIVPFAYAIAGLWKKKYAEWTKPALSWALFAAAILGLGIAMGAMWAYESLTFGGYWAWDPVENASLVPWLILIAGIHTLLIFRATGRSLRASALFLILSFLFILYSTYLTRSGDLQDTSVHAFTDLGMNWQLRIFLFIFIIPSFVLFFSRLKQIPHIVKEEESSSREFWMFIGSLVLFLSAITIIVMTSLPVFNKIASVFIGDDSNLFKPLAMGDDSAFAYNRILIFVAIIIGLLTATAQYLKYKNTAPGYFWKKILWPTVISAVLATLILVFGNIDYYVNGPGYLAAIWMAIIASVYAIIANLSYIWIGMKGKLKLSGGSITHFGFGLMLLGILISSSKKEVISFNTSGIFIDFGKESTERSGENLTLVKGVETKMGKYRVTYESDSMNPFKPLWYYNLKFRNVDGKEEFTLTPNAFINYKGNEGLMANPDARHYWDHDIFAYITSLPDPEKNKDTSSFNYQTMQIGDTAFYSKGFMVLEKIDQYDNIPVEGTNPEDIATMATVKVVSQQQSIYTSKPVVIEKKGNFFSMMDTVISENLVLTINKAGKDNVELGVKESDSILKYVTLKAYKFPFIRVLWLGIAIMVIGFIVSMRRRQLAK
jgi:cytochrome c-type biogenesis protein CcmF